MWMCRTNLICRNGKLDLAAANEAPGIPVSIRFEIESQGGGKYVFNDVEIADDFDMDRVVLDGEVREKAISLLLNREDLWEEFCIMADYKLSGAI